MNQSVLPSAKLVALGGVVLFFGLIGLYVREFPVFTNTIGGSRLVLGALLFGAISGSAIVYGLRQRLTPWERHLPETGLILASCILFMPLFASLLNRAGGAIEHQRFVFVSETPYLASNYGILLGEKIKPSGYRLTVKRENRLYRFQYKSQAYFPLTKPGDPVLLPVRKGLLGIGVVELR